MFRTTQKPFHSYVMLLNYHTGLKNSQISRVSALVFIERPGTNTGKDLSCSRNGSITRKMGVAHKWF